MNLKGRISPTSKILLLCLLCLWLPQSFAEDQVQQLMATKTTVDTLWILMAAVLVFFMQAGFALLESGSTRAKNSINVMMKNYVDVCMATLVFWVVGYGMMFGDSAGGFIGVSGFAFSTGNDQDFAFILFQAMFAATAATIASGAMAERTLFHSYIICAAIITAVIYPVYGHWVWNADGWLAKRGFIDFAGSSVVHSVGAWCALAGVIVVGPRLGRFDRETGEVRDIPGHNLSMVALGGFILWLGWFGFNAGSTLDAGGNIGAIALNTHLAASAGTLGVVVFSIIFQRPLLLTSSINGSLAGLVAITAGCATMAPAYALLTGFIGGLIVIPATDLLLRLQIDDVVGAIPVHGFAGVWGTMAAGLFYQTDMFNPERLSTQLLGVVIAFLWAFGMSMMVYIFVHYFMGLRAENRHQQTGLDYSEHSEVGYPEFHALTQHFK